MPHDWRDLLEGMEFQVKLPESKLPKIQISLTQAVPILTRVLIEESMLLPFEVRGTVRASCEAIQLNSTTKVGEAMLRKLGKKRKGKRAKS